MGGFGALGGALDGVVEWPDLGFEDLREALDSALALFLDMGAAVVSVDVELDLSVSVLVSESM